MSNDDLPAVHFGAQLIAPGRTRFRLWAPSLRQVELAIDGRAAVAMGAQPDGWFEVEADCGAGTRYQYVVTDADGNRMSIPDPASQAQAGDVHDPSVVVDHAAYRWQHADWRGRPWHQAVLYELHVGVLGGFAGVMQRLPALAALGVTAVELMPVADFPGPRNWGYDGVLPFAPDAAYGTPDQLKALIDAAHGLGMMVFLDVVYNHFGPDGNYLGAIAKPFFRDDIHTPWGAAIDFRQRAVRDFFTANALYWLREYRFDGLRFDAVHAISERDWLVEMADTVRAGIDPLRHVHLVLENDDNAATLLAPPFDAQWNDDGHHVLHVLLSGEREGYYRDYGEQPARMLARCLAEGFVYQGEPSPHRGNQPRGENSAQLPPTAFVLFLQNHDQIGNRAFGDRLSAAAHPDALRAAYGLLLLAPQIPMLFMGDEDASDAPFLFFTSYADAQLAEAVREGRRQEFAGFAAFADAEQRARIPDPNGEDAFTRSIPTADAPQAPAWREWIRQLLAIRHAQVVPRLAGAYSLGATVLGDAAVSARWRLGDGTTLVLAINLDAAPVTVALDVLAHAGGADLLFETSGALAAIGADRLPGYAFVALLEPAP